MQLAQTTHILLEIVEICSDYACFIGNRCDWLRACLLRVETLRLAQLMQISVAIVAIGSEYVCFSWNSCNWLRIFVIHLKSLQLAQTMHDSHEINAIDSDHASFSWNSCHCRIKYAWLAENRCNWRSLCIFSLKYLQLAQIMHVSVEIVEIGSDYAHSN